MADKKNKTYSQIWEDTPAWKRVLMNMDPPRTSEEDYKANINTYAKEARQAAKIEAEKIAEKNSPEEGKDFLSSVTKAIGVLRAIGSAGRQPAQQKQRGGKVVKKTSTVKRSSNGKRKQPVKKTTWKTKETTRRS